ncbi:hypothetical protein [Helicobacter ganmani]|uniref:hypothetical protein n=1 Tax=Helicobacter ganmani TaxID=60246 RepID=UPI003A890C06
MYYSYDKEAKDYIQSTLEKISSKLQNLKGKRDKKSRNKKVHLQECLECLTRCNSEMDTDKYDYFIYKIYTMEWGGLEVSKEMESKRLDKNQESLPSLKEIAQTTFRKEVEEMITNDPLYKKRMEQYDASGVPYSISVRQAKLALLEAGLLERIEEAVQNMDKETQIAWEYATEFTRNNPLILGFAQVLKLSKKQIDNLFIKAKTL